MRRQLPLPPSVHYGWLIVMAGSLGIFACIGLGRFALGMLLPAMGADLQLSYGQMGLLSTSNFVGYLAGIIAAPLLVRRLGARGLIVCALTLCGLSMIAIALADKLSVITAWYVATGIGSALANIPIMAMLSAWFESRLRAKAAGYVVSGNGAAIVVSGLTLPWLNSASAMSWRLSWLVLGTVVLAVALISLLVLRNRPQDLGLAPAGTGKRSPAAPGHGLDARRSVPSFLVLHLGLIYGLFGCTFVTYMTFMVTTMVRQFGFPQQTAGAFWSWVGLLSLVSGPLFGTLADRFSRRRILALVLAIQALAYLLAGLAVGVWPLYASIACFGIVAWSVPSIMAALAGDYAGPDKAFALFGALTFIFALGQVAGPTFAGLLAEHTGTFSASYLVAALLAATAAVLALFLPAGMRR